MTTDLITKINDEQIKLIKRQVAKDATDDELSLFLYQAERTGLDPLARQIVFQKYKSKDGKSNVSIITTIDGYRLIADRTGRYAGSNDYLFDEGINQYEHTELERRFPTTATVTVYKIVSRQRVPFTATAAWDSYYPGEKRGFMWRKMPYLMLGKCAEALALRKAFPAELSGLYTTEEMDQATQDFTDVTPQPIAKPKALPKKINGNGKLSRPLDPNKLKEGLLKRTAESNDQDPITENQIGLLASKLEECFAGDSDARGKRLSVLHWLWDAESSQELTKAQAKATLDWLLTGEKDDTGDYPLHSDAPEEANRVLKEAMIAAGQQEMAI